MKLSPHQFSGMYGGPCKTGGFCHWEFTGEQKIALIWRCTVCDRRHPLTLTGLCSVCDFQNDLNPATGAVMLHHDLTNKLMLDVAGRTPRVCLGSGWAPK